MLRFVRPAVVILAVLSLLVAAGCEKKGGVPGLTDTEIKIGHINPYSGPASAYGTIGRTLQGYFKYVNDNGGINGRKIDFVTYDDGYSPPKTVEMARKLVEQDQVMFMFQSLGTPTNSAIHKYMNEKKVPHLFVATGASKWGDPKGHPWTMGWQPNYKTEAKIYAKYIYENFPKAKIGILYQNDDFGKDYLHGLKEGLEGLTKGGPGPKLVSEQSYEVTDPTIDSQIVNMKNAGVDVLVSASTPKFAAQSIKKIPAINWKPVHLLTNVSVSIKSVFEPAGYKNGEGIISAAYQIDPDDAEFKDSEGVKKWVEFMKKYYPEGSLHNASNAYAWAVGHTLMHVLDKAGKDLTRAKIIEAASSMRNFVPPMLLPGVKISTSKDDFYPIESFQLMRFNSSKKRFERFGKVLSYESS